MPPHLKMPNATCYLKHCPPICHKNHFSQLLDWHNASWLQVSCRYIRRFSNNTENITALKQIYQNFRVLSWPRIFLFPFLSTGEMGTPRLSMQHLQFFTLESYMYFNGSWCATITWKTHPYLSRRSCTEAFTAVAVYFKDSQIFGLVICLVVSARKPNFADGSK